MQSAHPDVVWISLRIDETLLQFNPHLAMNYPQEVKSFANAHNYLAAETAGCSWSGEL